jgi:hypothetical protein
MAGFMSVLQWIWSGIWFVLVSIWQLFLIWGYVFIAPLENLETLWILIPIYFNWILAEFFQEKKGTSLGNAISNGGVALWVSIDWIRYITRGIGAGQLKFGWAVFFKYFTAVVVAVYGIIIIYNGIKARKYIKWIGRIREITYIMIMFTPIMYGILKMSWLFFIAFILFFPLYYFLIELLDWWIPDPESIKEDESKDKKGLDSYSSTSSYTGVGSSFSSRNFSNTPPAYGNKSPTSNQYNKDFKF